MIKLTPEAQTRVAERRAWHEERKAVAANLDNQNLVLMAKMCMANMRPIDFPPGDPVYDATMWHVVLPELLRRVSELPEEGD
jgi:hypothetical protein